MAHLQLMGELALFDSAKAAKRGEPLLSDVKPLVIPAYLALTPGSRSRRDHIAELLWSGHHPRDARRSLRQALYVLSQHVADPVVSSDGRHLSLTGISSCDVWWLEEAIAAGDHERVLASGRRPILEYLAGGLSEELRAWIAMHDAHRRTAWRESTRALIEGAVEDGELPKAETLARDWVGGEPLAEEPRVVLIRVLAARGADAAAHGVYEEYRSLLRATQERKPSEELTRQVRSLGRVLLEDREWESLRSPERLPLTRREARRYAWLILAAGILIGAGVPFALATCSG